jgi:hypothetical protein
VHEAAAAGRAGEVHALAPALAAEVLASAPVALAIRVLAGGPHAVAAAIELAEAFAMHEVVAGPRDEIGPAAEGATVRSHPLATRGRSAYTRKR